MARIERNTPKATPLQKSSKNTKEKARQPSKKRTSASDNDDNGSSDSEDGEDGDDEEMDPVEYHKLLSSLFPSRNASRKVAAGERLKKLLLKDVCNESETDDDSDADADPDPKKKGKTNKQTNKKTAAVSASKAKSKGGKNSKKKDEDAEETEEDVDAADVVDVFSGKKKSTRSSSKSAAAGGGGSSSNYNIIFTIGGADELCDDEEDEDYDSDYGSGEDEAEEESENEDVSVSSVSDSSGESDSEDDEEEEEYEEDEDSDEEYEEEEEVTILKPRRKNAAITARQASTKGKIDVVDRAGKKKAESKDVVVVDGDENENEGSSKSDKRRIDGNSAEVLSTLKRFRDENTGNKLLCESMDMGIEHYQSKVEKSDRQDDRKKQKQKEKNERIFKKLLRDKNTANDYTFFEKLDKDVQMKLIKEVRNVNKISNVDTPYRISLLQAEIPHTFKSIALKKLNSLKCMEPGSGEFYKIKNWVDTFMRIPFNTVRTLPVNISDGVDKCHEFMSNAQKTLDDAVYGLSDAKMQIMQMLGQLVTNPQAIGSAIAIKGPMGTGKTTLVKEGISKILDRPFAFIALGGATDSSFLEGHSYTYEGSMWGKIVQIIIDSKCMNPVIYFDELDKISDTPKGDEIAGILTHLTDTSQNSQFHDKYFSEIDFDLSKCLFIFSYNDESKVNPILRDRMYRIQTKGYESKEKTIIANSHIIPHVREQVLFDKEDIIIPDVTIHHIIESFCDKEAGVRNLKRCVEIIYTKLNLYRLMKPGSNLFQGEMSIDVSFPFTVTKEVVDKLIKSEEKVWTAQGMYV